MNINCIATSKPCYNARVCIYLIETHNPPKGKIIKELFKQSLIKTGISQPNRIGIGCFFLL